MRILTPLTVQKREPPLGRGRISSCPYFFRESKSSFSSWNNHHYWQSMGRQKQIMGEGYILITTVTINALIFLISSSRILSEVLCQLLPLLFCLRSRTHNCLLASTTISEDTTTYLRCGCLLPALFCHPQLSQLVLFTSHCPLLNTVTTLGISWSSSHPQTFLVNCIFPVWLISFCDQTQKRKRSNKALWIYLQITISDQK